MMVRYVKQKDNTSCGPIALINTLKWLGYSVSYDFLHIARYMCKCESNRSKDGGGTTDMNFERALKSFGIKKKRKIQPTIKELDKHIDSGGIAIISYFNTYPMCKFKKDAGHFALCISRTSRTYMMVNDKDNKTKNRRYRNTMRSMLSNEGDGYKCWAWFISK